MKKVFLIIAAAMLVGSMFSSCKSYERCPAYGNIDMQEQATEPA